MMAKISKAWDIAQLVQGLPTTQHSVPKCQRGREPRKEDWRGGNRRKKKKLKKKSGGSYALKTLPWETAFLSSL